MAGLQRSAQTFRRSGSSGLVWDERFLTDDGGGGEDAARPELRHSRSVGSVGMARRGRGEHGKKEAKQGSRRRFEAKDVAPATDPPSPRVSGCILCAVFRGACAASRRAKPRKQ